MKYNKIKKGFTLIELMIFFVFLSLVLAAAAPLITKKVKNIPTRRPHGTFICYGDRYELYNSSRLVDSGEGCKFTPPSKIGLYKIQVVGSGAGGYDYSEISEDEKQVESGFVMDGPVNQRGYYGAHGIKKFSPAQFKYLLNDIPFTIVKSGTNAEDGKDVNTDNKNVLDRNIKFKFDNGGACTGLPFDGSSLQLFTHGGSMFLDRRYCIEAWTLTNENVYPEINRMIQKLPEKVNCNNGGGYDCYVLYADMAKDYVRRTLDMRVNNTFNTFGYQSNWSQRTGSSVVVDSVTLLNGLLLRGGKGGESKGLYLSGKIDFTTKIADGSGFRSTKVADSDVESYLKNLFAPSEGAKGYSYIWGIRDKKGVFDVNNATWLSNPTYSSSSDGDGRNVSSYDTICAWNVCISNKNLPTGGKGGKAEKRQYPYKAFNGEWFVFDVLVASKENPAESNLNGDDASTQLSSKNWFLRTNDNVKYTYGDYIYGANLEGYRTSIPRITVNTKLKMRKYKLGNGGGGAKASMAYVPSLSDDCVFNIPQGGPALSSQMTVTQEQLDKLHDSLSTTLSCNGGAFKVSAEGGIYDNGTTSFEKDGFEYLNDDGTVSANLPEAYYIVSEGRTSGLNLSNVFTKFKIAQSDFGNGGDGPYVTDKCTAPRGSAFMKTIYQTLAGTKYGNYEDYRHLSYVINPNATCSIKEHVDVKPASTGKRGVIIISW